MWAKKNPMSVVQKILRHFSSEPIPNLLLTIIEVEERVQAYLSPSSVGPIGVTPIPVYPPPSALAPPIEGGRLSPLMIPLLAPKLKSMSENECGSLQEWILQVSVKFPRSRYEKRIFQEFFFHWTEFWFTSKMRPL